MSAQYTPGPWDYVPGNENHGPYVVTDFGSTVADLYTMSRPAPWSREEPKPVPFLHEMAEANARLIAAAPDLLFALKGAEAWLTAALECPTWSWDGDQHEAATYSRDQARAAIAQAEGRSQDGTTEQSALPREAQPIPTGET